MRRCTPAALVVVVERRQVVVDERERVHEFERARRRQGGLQLAQGGATPGEGGSPERALEILAELSELAKSVEEELERAKRAAEADAAQS